MPACRLCMVSGGLTRPYSSQHIRRVSLSCCRWLYLHKKCAETLGLCRARLRLNIHGQRIHRGLKESHALTSGSTAGRAGAAILVLARNEDCDSVLLSMQRMEHRFNIKFQYPYVFLNNAPFDVAFQERHAFCTLAVHIENISKDWLSADGTTGLHPEMLRLLAH